MAYLNGNATCFRPSLTIEQVEGAAPERATEVYELEYSYGYWDAMGDSGKYHFFFYEPDIDIYEGVEIKTVDVKFNGEWVNLTEYAAERGGFELANKKVYYDEEVVGNVFAAVYFPFPQNELISAIMSMMLESIRITYYTE